MMSTRVFPCAPTTTMVVVGVVLAVLLVCGWTPPSSQAFSVPPPSHRTTTITGDVSIQHHPRRQHRQRYYDTSLASIFDKLNAFFEELDAFVDDATARRLGKGHVFYGKRKSSFYGENDKGRKLDKSVPDPLGTSKRMLSNEMSRSPVRT
jgi:hypothetical protein